MDKVTKKILITWIKFFTFNTVITLFLIIFTTFAFYQVNGSSMNPEINDSQIFLCQKNYYQVNKNDVIVFNQSKLNYLVAHKVIKKFDNKTFRTKGVNNKFKDNYIVRQKNIRCKKFY